LRPLIDNDPRAENTELPTGIDAVEETSQPSS
jgi:hypothetical protein